MKHESGSCPVDICSLAFFEHLPAVIILNSPAEIELTTRCSCCGSSARKLPVSLDPFPIALPSLIYSESMLRQVSKNKVLCIVLFQTLLRNIPRLTVKYF
jgi:hypothetical protein